MKLILKSIFIFFAVGVGLYPLLYGITDMSKGYLASKEVQLQNPLWVILFYLHISFGAIALLVGWSQFLSGFRARKLHWHRALGKTYVVSVLISGMSGLYIAWSAVGGVVARWGFIGMDLAWLSTTILAYMAIRQKNVVAHENWMIRSYAVCFAAVTLRLWLPVFAVLSSMEFAEYYRIIAWLSWIPNLIVAQYIINKRTTTGLTAI